MLPVWHFFCLSLQWLICWWTNTNWSLFWFGFTLHLIIISSFQQVSNLSCLMKWSERLGMNIIDQREQKWIIYAIKQKIIKRNDFLLCWSEGKNLAYSRQWWLRYEFYYEIVLEVKEETIAAPLMTTTSTLNLLLRVLLRSWNLWCENT